MPVLLACLKSILMSKIPTERVYRHDMGTARFNSFILSYKESDIWCGLSKNCDLDKIKKFALQELQNLRNKLDKYIETHPKFLKSKRPIDFDHSSPAIIKKMISASNYAAIGPMAAVAGAFAQYLGEHIKKEFDPKELILENGGDNYMIIEKPLVTSIFAGESTLSEKIGLKILPEYSPLGVCTSAGTFGSSYSSGKADAVTIAAKNTMLADAFATSLANRIKTKEDIDKVIQSIKDRKEMLSCVIIKADKMAVKGELEIEVL